MKIFISYSHETDEHNNRVRKLVMRLRGAGFDVMYDGDTALGERIGDHMDMAISECDYVLFICTPTYREKADNREGGVGFETTIITAELFRNHQERRFIPVLFSGTWNDVPHWALGKLGVDLSNNFTYESELKRLIDGLRGYTLIVRDTDNAEFAEKNRMVDIFRRAEGINDAAELRKCFEYYQNSLNAYENDSNFLALVGICYLKSECYSSAQSMFQQAIDNVTFNSEVYYYAALSLLKGKMPFVRTLKEIDVIVDYIDHAVKLCLPGDLAAKKYFCLAKIVYDDYFSRKHMRSSKLEAILQRSGGYHMNREDFEQVLAYLNK